MINCMSKSEPGGAAAADDDDEDENIEKREEAELTAEYVEDICGTSFGLSTLIALNGSACICIYVCVCHVMCG